MSEIAILSGKGGTGKTSLSAAFATLNNHMVVADCDVDAANLHLILQPENYQEEKFITGYKAVINGNSCIDCGMCMYYCRFDAITHLGPSFAISAVSCDGCRLCVRICPTQSISMVASDNSRWYVGDYRNGKMIHARLSPGEDNSGKLVSVVREKARQTAKEMGWKTIIIDGPPGTGCPVISAVTGADKVVIVTEPSKSGFHDMKRALELTSNFKVKPYIVINKYDLNEQITHEIEEWSRGQKIPVVGKIPFDQSIVTAMLNGQSIIEWRPESDISREIKIIYDLVFNYK